jgi:thiamine-monophosphate kinase
MIQGIESDGDGKEQLLTDVGEYRVHAIIEGILNAGDMRNVGDDCAMMELSDESMLLINVDRLANGVAPHMRARLSVAQTFSDIICMGGRPESYLVALTLPRDTTLRSLRDLTSAIQSDVESYGARLIGGDTKEGTSFHMVGVGLGTASKKSLVRRVGAEPGMVIGVTSAAGGLWGPRWAHAVIDAFDLNVSDALADACREADYLLTLPLAESLAITATGHAMAGLDLSDGIGGGLKILSRASQVGVNIHRDRVRGLVDPSLQPVVKALDLPLECMALSPGYNWENMYAVPEDKVDIVTRAAMDAGGMFTIIGEVTEEMGIQLDGRKIDLELLPADEKFAKEYAWEDRFGAWQRNCHRLLGRY